jgi:uncharacterized protein (DUF362 family)
MNHTDVTIGRGQGAYANTRAALSGIDLSAVCGKRVLVKPNVARVAVPNSGIVTHPEVVAATIDALREAGAEVAVGESPIVGVKVFEAFEKAGISAVAESRMCPLIDLDRRRFVEVPVPGGRAIQSLRVCPEALEFDLVVSVPVMKTHMHTGVTLSVKNMKGCLWRRSKVELHMLPPIDGDDNKPIDIAIAEMSSVLRPGLSVIDGTVGLEGLGPSAGQPKPLGLVLASREAYAADAVACRLMGIAPADVPHLRIAAERGFGSIDVGSMNVTPGHWQEWISPFAAPPENLAIEFPNITIHDKNSCSACQSTLFLFLRRFQNRLFDYFPSDTAIQIAIGKGHQELPEGTLCLGNCTANLRDKGVFVRGCPPVGSQILNALEGQPDHKDSTGGDAAASDACRPPEDGG